MKRETRFAGFALAVLLVLSGLALAQDRDGDRDDYGYGRGGNGSQARQYGYQNGYRDGLSHGREEAREHDPGDFRSRDWRNANRGYQSSMGSYDQFRDGYRDGYRAGYEEAFRQYRGGGYGGPVYGGPGNGGPGYGVPGYGGNQAYNFGYQDGASVARGDIRDHKPFNPNPRSKYEDEDRGYNSSLGDKGAYRARYADGYRAGYQATFRRY